MLAVLTAEDIAVLGAVIAFGCVVWMFVAYMAWRLWRDAACSLLHRWRSK